MGVAVQHVDLFLAGDIGGIVGQQQIMVAVSGQGVEYRAVTLGIVGEKKPPPIMSSACFNSPLP